MPNSYSELSFEKAATLWDVEELLKELQKLQSNNVHRISVKLPRKHKMKFFKDSWISSFIATASSPGTMLTVRDWHNSNNQSEIVERFSNSLIGITSAFLANEISNTQHHKFNIDIDEIVEQIAYNNDGVIEDSESGKSFVFCSFDSENDKTNFPKPLALSANSKEEFIKKFLEIKRFKIDADPATTKQSIQLSFTHEFDRELASLIYELYENTIQHGRYNEHNEVIRGVRSFRVKRHTSYTIESLLDQAQQFEELESYINSSQQKKNLRFYEISISDNGLGIIERLVATRPETTRSLAFTTLNRPAQLNKIISESLSSKLYPGSGLGLASALKNLRYLKGFLSLRTNDLWVYFNGADGSETSNLQLSPVKNSEHLSRMKGTHYNIIIPLF